MGIISDFLNLKQQIEENKKTNPFHKITFYSQKKKLVKNAEKLLQANEPLDKNEILELAQSLHGLGVGYDNGFYDNKVTVEYFAGSECFRLTLMPENFENTQIKSFQLLVSSKEKSMEITIQIEEKVDVIKQHRLNCTKIYTNIKELKPYLKICNEKLYILIHDYIYDILAEMR